MPDEPALIGGPYRAPRCRVGSTLFDIVRGDLTVVRISDAPVPWPLGRTHPVCRPKPILTGGLVRALRTESELAVMHHWGVSRWTVCRWRRALAVPRFNAGTLEIWRQAALTKLTPEMRRRAHEAQRTNRLRKEGRANAEKNVR
jgi:hypothetical protein